MSPFSKLASGLILLSVAGLFPPAADAQVAALQVVEVIRPTVLRPFEILVTGRMQGDVALALDRIHVDEGTVFVHARARPSNSPLEASFALRVALPGLPFAGANDLVLLVGEPGSPGSVQASTHFFVHTSPQTVAVEQDPSGLARVRIKGLASEARLDGPPRLQGSTIEVPLVLGCDVECGGDAGPPLRYFDLSSEPIGQLPAGSYLLELIEEQPPYGRARIAWRERVDLLEGPLLLAGERFEVAVELDPPHGERPRLVRPPSGDSALFYFFDPANWELMVKVLEGCALNDHFWVFAAASTDVGYTLRVRDRLRGETREYHHHGGSPAPALTDVDAFPCTYELP